MSPIPPRIVPATAVSAGQPMTTSEAGPWCFQVADETRREIVADGDTGLRRAANRAVGTVDAVVDRFPTRSADREMAQRIYEGVQMLRVMAYGWRPARSHVPVDDIVEGTGMEDTDGVVVFESVYSDNWFRAEKGARVWLLQRDVCCDKCRDKFVVRMEAGQ